jgi:hypothetical protein
LVPQAFEPSPEPALYAYKDAGTTVEVMDKDLKGVAIVISGGTKPTEGSNTQNQE